MYWKRSVVFGVFWIPATINNWWNTWKYNFKGLIIKTKPQNNYNHFDIYLTKLSFKFPLIIAAENNLYSIEFNIETDLCGDMSKWYCSVCFYLKTCLWTIHIPYFPLSHIYTSTRVLRDKTCNNVIQVLLPLASLHN